jgi:hypothetical protein
MNGPSSSAIKITNQLPKMSTLTTKFWEQFYRWDEPVGTPVPGYSLLFTVPGDLPVFLKIALEMCSRQASGHLVETLVIPDHLTTGLPELLEPWAKDYAVSPLRLVTLGPLDEVLAHKLNHPSVTHWLQLIRGAMATQATHAVLHDSDLFMTDRNFLESHYETCVKRRLACLGVSPIWDSWFQEQGLDHVVAPWEMILELAWLRSFQPWQLQAHENVIDGKRYRFDTTIWAQCKTASERIGRYPEETGFIHFGHVVSGYRWFQQSPRPYEDEHFRLLLIRLLIDAYDTSGWPCEVPSLADLVKGLVVKSSPVTYLRESTRQRYPGFRSTLQCLLSSGLLNDERASMMEDEIAPFDRALA